MPSYHISASPFVSISYGYDNVSGVYLSVFDSRLDYSDTQSEEVNQIAADTCVSDEHGVGVNGCYVDLYTGKTSLVGKKVCEETMGVFMIRFGLSQGQVNGCFAGLKSDTSSKSESACLVCSELTAKSCTSCKCSYYCSRECQQKDWPLHKFICTSLPLPVKRSTSSSVYGILLDEDSLKPKFIEVQLKTTSVFENQSVEEVDLVPFLGPNDYGLHQMPRNVVNPSRKMRNTLVFRFRDAFLYDGSKPNKCIQKMTKNRQFHDWRGPIVVLKSAGTNLYVNTSYMDIESSDVADLIDYFLFYGNANYSEQ
jgi:hypothetical protein